MTMESQANRILVTTKGEAKIILTDGDTATLHAPFPSPPGSPLYGTLKGTEHQLRVKVHGCRAIVPADTEKCFEITGRWVSLSREARALLLPSNVPTT
jgi:hypothetical protein